MRPSGAYRLLLLQLLAALAQGCDINCNDWSEAGVSQRGAVSLIQAVSQKDPQKPRLVKHHDASRLSLETKRSREPREKTDLALVPAPYRIKQGTGDWEVVRLRVEASADHKDIITKVVESAAPLYNITGRVPLEVDDVGSSRDTVVRVSMLAGFEEEHYKLHSNEAGVEIKASTERGLFNGLLTLRQLLVNKPRRYHHDVHWHRPEVDIADAPATEWRGMMLDCARHFFPPEDVKKFLRTMAIFKYNRFHWHLTDDQGWRFPVEGWPELVKTGAWRDGSPHNQSDTLGLRHDGVPHGGSYTLEDIQDIVDYAASLFIEVVPEVDIPGHAQAAIAAYPELGNGDIAGWEAPQVAHFFGPQNYTLAPTQRSFDFVRDVVDAEAKLIPSRYVHLGGDEVLPYQWANSSQALAFMRSSNLGREPKDAGAIQSYFQTIGIEQVLKHNRRPVVWEEAAEEGRDLPTDAIVMIWNVHGAGFHSRVSNFTKRGYDVILAPASYTYLDFSEYHVSGEFENPMVEGTVSFSTSYSLPVVEHTRGEGKVLGGQAQLWTEYLQSRDHLEYNAWPRAAAIAERLWEGGQSAVDNLAAFKERLGPRLAELGYMGVHFRPFRPGPRLRDL